jgi:putative tryptophan/tyrosine transport system substrate-binding protein
LAAEREPSLHIDAAKKVFSAPVLPGRTGALANITQPPQAAAQRLPAMYEWPNMAEDGGLVGYGANLTQLFRDIFARQCVKLLRGVKPADIPVEQPSKFEPVINLKTANALGLTVPPTLLARADKVIE